MSGNERLEAKSGPLGNLSQAYFGSLDTVVKGCEPALKGMGQWNLVWLGLLTRRSQAWLEIPLRLGRCKTPVDLINEQLRFWQAAASDYVETQHRLAATVGACGLAAKPNGQLPRDYITFQEPEEVAVPKRSERKAA